MPLATPAGEAPPSPLVGEGWGGGRLPRRRRTVAVGAARGPRAAHGPTPVTPAKAGVSCRFRAVTPAKAGVSSGQRKDSRLRGNDESRPARPRPETP